MTCPLERNHSFHDSLFLTQEDIVGKLEFVEAIEQTDPYINQLQPRTNYYERVRRALSYVPDEHKRAALTVFANAIYLPRHLLEESWQFLFEEVAQSYHQGKTKESFLDSFKIFELDPAGMTDDFIHGNSIPGRLDRPEDRIVSLADMVSELLRLTDAQGEMLAQTQQVVNRLFSKPHWILLVDNSLSGQSLKSELKRYCSVLDLVADFARRPKIIVLIQVYTSDARRAIESEIGNKYLPSIDIRHALFFDDRFKITADSCMLVQDRAVREAIKGLCSWLAQDVLAHDPVLDRMRSNSDGDVSLGFRSGAWTLVTRQNCPSNSLPILWYAPQQGCPVEGGHTYRGPFPRGQSRISAEQESVTSTRFRLLFEEATKVKVIDKLRQEVSRSDE